MHKKPKAILRPLLIAVCIVSTLTLVWQTLDKSRGDAAYESAREIATPGTPAASPATEPVPRETGPAQERKPVWVPAPIDPEDPNLSQLQQLDIAALQEVNPEVLGWIFIPESKIDYPILQGEDNEYYLTHTWQKQYNSVGSIFLECQNPSDFTNFNTILYGHNMADGSMFSDVSRYLNQWYFDQHPYIYIVLPDQILRYEIFAAYKAPTDSPVYGLSYNQRETRQKLLDHAGENSAVESSIAPEITDRILTLSTCTGYGYSSRWVVQARLPMVLE